MECKCNGNKCKKKEEFEDVIKCDVCNKIITYYYFKKHCKTKNHLRKVNKNVVHTVYVDEIVLKFD